MPQVSLLGILVEAGQGTCYDPRSEPGIRTNLSIGMLNNRYPCHSAYPLVFRK